MKIEFEGDYERVMVEAMWLAWIEQPERPMDATAAAMSMQIERTFKESGAKKPTVDAVSWSSWSGIDLRILDPKTGYVNRLNFSLDKAKEIHSLLSEIIPKLENRK